MSNKKIKTGIASDFDTSIEGNNLIITYRTKEAARLNLRILAVAYQDLGVYLGNLEAKQKAEETAASEEKVSYSPVEVDKFIQVYQGLQRKYTSKYSTYKSTGRYYASFESATAQAKANKLEPSEYIQHLINYFSRRNANAQVAFPYPNQLHGEFAQQVIIDQIGRGSAKSIPDSARADKLAQTNKWVQFDKDAAYQEAYFRMKANKHTRFDVEYIKARQTQVLGQPKEWLLKKERELNKREKAEGTDVNEE